MKQQEITINICGDFFIDPQLCRLSFFDDSIIQLFHTSDLNIVNLESPITANISKKIMKSGPHLYQSINTFSHLEKIRCDLVTLANNHIMDFNTDGLLDTISACKERYIGTVGCGLSLNDARIPFKKDIRGIKIAVLNFAEHEYSIATEEKPGANPLNIVESSRQIKEARENNDFVIVIIHGGHEHYNLPSPRMVSQYRFLADMGASIIVSHHTHCISGFELYKEVPIFYSLGNFLFTRKFESESAHIGLVLDLKLSKLEGIKWELVPIKKNSSNHLLSTLEGLEKQKVFDEIYHYNEIISDEAHLLKEWDRFIEYNVDEALFVFSPINLIRNKKLKRALKKIGINRLLMNKPHYNKMFSCINCESLLDVSIGSMQKYLSNNL